MANPTESKQRKSSDPSSICTGNRYEILMDESDKISSEQKQENTVITATQSPLFSQDRSLTNNPIDINASNADYINEPQLPNYGNIPQNTINTHNTQSAQALQGESHNQSDVNSESAHSKRPLQSLEGEIHDQPNISSKEVPFSLQSQTVGGQRPGQAMHQSVVLIGDSIIKNIVPQKLTRKKVYKFTYPVRTVEEIDQEFRNKCSNTEASHVIIHCGTNNMTTDTANECASKIEQLCSTVKMIYPNAKIGVSGLTERNDVSIHDKLLEVNSKIKEMCALNKYSFIHHVNIDRSCLNKSKIHLNAKGSALLAASFINFTRGRKQLSQIINQKIFGWKKHYVNWELYSRRREGELLNFLFFNSRV